ncbi:TetR/AcrR family transcriptional regulator [Halodesulfovibrio spirochaetisodalis]|uniref:TetR/AcrR family transcriptional regulator n=1 Tax=Halodesulfovibrio spirochaetisodalis TaxID=1560234 RepID=UPI00083251C7|nr:TetR/AcrR family transcriptional regulator [Halodesulfovibrio spirochaetisodalis]
MNNSLRTKPQQERAIATINKILTASKRVLLTEGYEKFTTNKVAAESGLNIGTIYRYFPDKENIIIRLYADRLDESHTFLIDQISYEAAWGNIVEFIGCLLKNFITDHSPEDHVLAVELTKAGVMNQHIKELSETHDSRIRSVLYETIEERFGLAVDRRQIRFWLALGMHLALMVSMEPEENKEYLTQQAVATITATVSEYMRQHPAG